MFDFIFENRDKKLNDLIKLGDCLGRSLRENIELFKICDIENRVYYVTEGNKIVSGKYSFQDGVALEEILVEDVEVYEDDEKFDTFVQSKVSGFVKSLYDNEIGEAETNFSTVIDSWNDRIKFDKTIARLHEKINKFDDSTNIIATPQFGRLLEVAPQLLAFLKENKEYIARIPEIGNAVILSNVVSNAFNLTRLNYQTLGESSEYRLQSEHTGTIYEMVCRQELIRKDILESKHQFDSAWATNEKIRSLAGCVYEKDSVVQDILIEAIKEVPYFAFVSKKQIGNTFKNALSLVENQLSIPDNDLREFISKIFEMKKTVKKELSSILNEKYGVNIQNLKETPTFKSLINTQVLIFEMLSRISPSNSLQKEVLSEVATMLKGKSGVQGIDVNDCLKILFEKAGYEEFLNSDNLLNHLDLKAVVSDVEPENYFSQDDGEFNPFVDSPPPPLEEQEVAPEAEKEVPVEKEETKESPMSKEEYLDALVNLEDILKVVDTSDDDEELGEGKKWGGNKEDKSKTRPGDEDYEAHKGSKSKTHKGKDFEDDEIEEKELTKKSDKRKKAKKENGIKHRKKVVKDALEDAEKKDKKRSKSKDIEEVGDDDDEV